MTEGSAIDPKTSGLKIPGIGRRGSRLIGLAALAVGFYVRLNLLIPVAAAAAIAVVLLKAKLIQDRLLVESVSVQGGQVAWMLVPVFLGADNMAFRIEVFGYALTVFVLAVRPRKWVAIVLLVYQGFGVLMNGVNLWDTSIGSEISRALVAHLGLRLLAILLLVMLLRRGLPVLADRKIAQVFE